MLTRLLHACGLYLGEKSELMPPQADNPEGFWEHLGFVALNDELLNELGGAWDLPPKTDENFSNPRFGPLGMKARLLIERFESTHIWGWKDPRNSLTLPFWQDLLPGLKTLIVVRNPLEVAHSMRERNGTSYSFGLRLWEIYNRRLLEAAGARERLITDYDSFFKNPEAELRRIGRFAGLPDNEADSAAALVSAPPVSTQGGTVIDEAPAVASSAPSRTMRCFTASIDQDSTIIERRPCGSHARPLRQAQHRSSVHTRLNPD